MAIEKETAVWLPVFRDLTYREIHAFIDGLYVGCVNEDRDHEYSREEHYWRAGYLAGRVILRNLTDETPKNV